VVEEKKQRPEQKPELSEPEFSLEPSVEVLKEYAPKKISKK